MPRKHGRGSLVAAGHEHGPAGVCTSSAWTPAALGSALAAFFLADAANVPLDGSLNAQQFTDTGPSGTFHLTQATAGSRPGYTASDAAYNNKGVITVTAGPGKWLLNSSFTLPTPYSIILVGQYSTAATNNVVAVVSDSTGIQIVSDASQLIAVFPVGVHSAVGTNSPHAIYVESSNSASDKLCVDAISGAGVTGNTGATGATEISLGAYGAGSFGMTTMKIRMLAIMGRKLTTTELTQFAAYIKADCGINAS